MLTWNDILEHLGDAQVDPFVGLPIIEEAIPLSHIPLVTFGE